MDRSYLAACETRLYVEKEMIRKANGNDCKNLAALSIQVWLHTYAIEGIRDVLSDFVLTTFTEDYYLNLLKNPNYQIYLYIENEHLVGFIVLNFDSFYKHEANGFEISTFYVQEHFQGQGIGKRLLTEIKKNHGNTFWLSTWVHNTAAISFYIKSGFKDIGSIEFKLGDESHENLVLLYNCT